MKNHLTMKDLPKEERPYEKCLQKGAQALTDAELLAVIIRTGSPGAQSLELASKVLQLPKCENGILGIHDLSVRELTDVRGIGEVKAVQIKCIAELSKRISKKNSRKSLCFQTPKTIADYYMEELCHERQEHLLLLMLNTKNHLLHESWVSKGTVNAAMISAREIFAEALRHDAVSVILLHNHPSGDPTPSREDITITRELKQAGEMLGILVADHIVIGDHSYTSLLEQGMI